MTCRHWIGNSTPVLHCHHYATLYTQLAMDCSLLDAKRPLAECAEDTWAEWLGDYFGAKGITDMRGRIALAEEAFAVSGQGKMRVVCAGPDSGEVALDFSHVDAGWLKKWGKHDGALNYMACGFIAAMFAMVFDKPPRFYRVLETQSIVSGAACSRFNVVAS